MHTNFHKLKKNLNRKKQCNSDSKIHYFNLLVYALIIFYIYVFLNTILVYIILSLLNELFSLCCKHFSMSLNDFLWGDS